MRFGLHGPQAPAILARVLVELAPDIADRVASLSEHAHVSDELDGATLIVAGTRELGRPGFDVYCAGRSPGPPSSPRSSRPAPSTAMRTRSRRCGSKPGRPRFGADMDTDTIPLEAGIEDRAISQTKGCYVGQEIIIRVLHRGGGRVARRLVGLTFDPGDGATRDVPAVGFAAAATATARSAASPAPPGRPRLGRVIALGYVARDAAEPGTVVTRRRSRRLGPPTSRRSPSCPPRDAAHRRRRCGRRSVTARYLVTRRLEGTHLAGLWEFPGGKCEPGESHRGLSAPRDARRARRRRARPRACCCRPFTTTA